jgi:hypothetical protein
VIEPTPAAEATAEPTSPPSEGEPTQPPASEGEPTAEVVPTEPIPGIPNTGAEAQPPVVDVQSPPESANLAPMLFRIFYDSDHNNTYKKGEGISGVSVYFLDAAANLAPTGSLMTSPTGEGAVRLPVGEQRVYIPYLGINIPLTRFPERELHSIWLPAVQLPDRVP